jgi:hypothetical protein
MKGENAFDWKEGFSQVFISQGKSIQGGSNVKLFGA